MILRRIAEHMKQQHWTGVFIELAVVVFGVFIGLQVSNWNTARVQAAEERAVLMRLHEEFKAVEPRLAAAADNLAESVRSTGLVIEALRSGVRPTDQEAFRNLLRSSNVLWDAPPLSATYSELVSTGALSNISNLELRATLMRYAADTKKYERELPAATSVVLDSHSNYFDAVQWSTDPDKWGGPGAVVSYDWDKLSNSKAELQAWQAYQHDMARYAKDELTELRAAIDILGREGR